MTLEPSGTFDNRSTQFRLQVHHPDVLVRLISARGFPFRRRFRATPALASAATRSPHYRTQIVIVMADISSGGCLCDLGSVTT